MDIKDELYAILSSADGYVSGQKIAGTLGVSRNAVWKAAEALKSEGCMIEAVRNRGYALIKESGVLSARRISDGLRGNAAKCRIITLGEVESTNTYLKKLAAENCPEGTVVIADEQSGGRGRMRRRFFSLKGGGLYLSLLLRPVTPASESLALTACAAVAAAGAIEKICGRKTQIKWGNDILIDGKKVCGILTEAAVSAENGMFDYVIIGIGVNVAAESFPPEISDIACAMFENTERVPRNELASEILNRMFELLESFDDRQFINEYRARSCVIGKEITVTDFSGGGVPRAARAVGVSDNGELIAEIDGKNIIISSGEVTIRMKEPEAKKENKPI